MNSAIFGFSEKELELIEWNLHHILHKNNHLKILGFGSRENFSNHNTFPAIILRSNTLLKSAIFLDPLPSTELHQQYGTESRTVYLTLRDFSPENKTFITLDFMHRLNAITYQAHNMLTRTMVI